MRWGLQIHPYFATGDSDGDGISEFAIVALLKRDGLKIVVVVFFGSNSGFSGEVSDPVRRRGAG